MLSHSNGDIGPGLSKLAVYASGKLLVTSTCTAAVIGFTGGIGTPGVAGCFVAGSVAGGALAKPVD